MKLKKKTIGLILMLPALIIVGFLILCLLYDMLFIGDPKAIFLVMAALAMFMAIVGSNLYLSND